nr:ubiquitin carboxyl-terminal hydrolase 12 isoform X6 [Tanacetum cinerariifolium]
MVHFRSLDRPKEDDFCLELVAHKLNLDDPSKIRLTPHNCYSQQPKPNPIKYRAEHLPDMLVHYKKVSDILYYEVLDIPLPELQGLKTLKIAFHHATKKEPVIYNIRLAVFRLSEFILLLRFIYLAVLSFCHLSKCMFKQVELSHPDAELRLLEVFYHKIFKIFPLTEKIENINDKYWTLRAEEVSLLLLFWAYSRKEKNLGPQDRLIHVYHFTKGATQNQMQVQNFREPFFLIIHGDETLAEVKGRIQQKLAVPDEEFAKWKFAFLSLGRPEYLEDTDVVSHHFQKRHGYGAWEQYLGLEHSDTTPKRAFTSNQKPIDEDNLAEQAKSVDTSSTGGSQSESLTGVIS